MKKLIFPLLLTLSSVANSGYVYKLMKLPEKKSDIIKIVSNKAIGNKQTLVPNGYFGIEGTADGF